MERRKELIVKNIRKEKMWHIHSALEAIEERKQADNMTGYAQKNNYLIHMKAEEKMNGENKRSIYGNNPSINNL
jgi:hypothetical protein